MSFTTVLSSLGDFTNTACVGVCYGEHLVRNLTHFAIATGLAVTAIEAGIPSALGAAAEAENAVHGILEDGEDDLRAHPEHKFF